MKKRIMTLHPQGKKGVSIDLYKYEQMKAAVLAVLAEKGSISFMKMMPEVANYLAGSFDGSVGWYFTTVKLDLEARGTILVNRKVSPQQINLS